MKNNINNDVLGTAILKGDADAFKLFFVRHHKNLLGFTTTLTRDIDQAEDIVQLAFITLWKKRKTLNDPNGLEQYLYATAKNLFIDRHRSTKSRADLYAELTYEAVHIENEDDEYVQERIRKLHKAIEGLPARCQEILKLNKFEGLGQAEVADYLGISLRTVEAQMRIAYQKIREAFDDNSLLLFLIARIRL